VTLSSLDLLPHLRGYKGFLEELTRFNTVGRLRNLRLTVSDVSEAIEHRQVAQRAEELLALVDRIQPLTGYLAEAQANLPADHPWSVQAAAARQSLLDDVRRRGRGEDARNAPALARELESLKEGYVTAYAELHRRLVLGPQADDRRRRLYDSPRLEALNTLARVDLLAPNRTELEGWVETISSLPTCRQFHEGAIADTPTCPHCNLRPAQRRQTGQSDQVLDQLDQRLDDMLERWRQALRSALSSETAQGSLAAMTPAERRPIEQFLAQSDQDAAIPDGFERAATQALRGIQALTLAVDELLAALREGGLPCTQEQLKQRFDGLVEAAMRGHDPRNTRLTLDQ
ncbi:MAG: hypothetical protein JXM73_15095, partial [Anaerolineae bacterium]|nr:hypothetical protein [Anaerolineae bacterium]